MVYPPGCIPASCYWVHLTTDQDNVATEDKQMKYLQFFYFVCVVTSKHDYPIFRKTKPSDCRNSLKVGCATVM